jgi:PAS domain S-box-containing protein
MEVVIINPVSIPPIVMATLMFYVGFNHLVIYFRIREKRENITFAITCFTVGIYAISCSALYNTLTPETGVEWQRIQVVILSCLAVVLLWFISDFTGYTNKKVVKLFTVYFIFACFLSILIKGDLTWTDIVSVKEISLPYGYSIVYNEMVPGILTNIHGLMGIIYGLYILKVSLKYYRSGNKEKGMPLIVSLLMLYAGILNDLAVTNRFYNFIYILEYSYIGIILVFTVYLTDNVIKTSRIKTELLESEKKYKTLFDSSNDSMTLIDVDTGEFIDYNAAAEKLYDSGNGDTIIGLTPDQLSPEYQPDGELSSKLAMEYIREAFINGSKTFEWSHCRNDGTLIPVIVTLSPIVLGNKRFVMSIAKDITERKNAEEEREKLLFELQDALENIKTLSGLLPICAKCKKIKDDKGYWNILENYIEEHSSASFSHSICSQCSDELYSHEEWYIDMKKKEE